MPKGKKQNFSLFFVRSARRRLGFGAGPDVAPSFSSQPKFMTLRHTAAIFGVHPNTLRTWDATGKLKAVRFGSRHDRRYSRDDVAALWAEQTRSIRSRRILPVVTQPRHRVAVGLGLATAVFVFGALQSGPAAVAETAKTSIVAVQPSTCTGWTNPTGAQTIDVANGSNPDLYTVKNSARLSGRDVGVTATDGTVTATFDQQAPVLECRGFAVNAKQAGTVTNVRLRVSLASTGRVNSTETLRLSGSIDGEVWTPVSTLPVRREDRNYVSVELPFVTDREQLRQLRLRVEGEFEPGGAAVVYVDGLVALVTIQPPTVPVKTTSSSSRQRELDRLTEFSQSAYDADDQPTIRLPKKQVKRTFWFSKRTEEWKLSAVALIDADGQERTIDYRTVDETDGDTTYSRLRLRMQQEHPGKYKLRVTMVSPSGTTEVIEEPFLWGVLAVNLRRANPSVGQTQEVAIGVLDDTGRTICNATVKATITDPKGRRSTFQTSNNSIVTNANCVDKGVTNEADYHFTLRLDQPGLYHIDVEADTTVGKRTSQENFTVESRERYDVERADYPTRIYPVADYPVRIAVTPKADYLGLVTERVPANFGITEVFPAGTVRLAVDNPNQQIIEWLVQWKAGQTYYLTYTFDAPDISPALFLTGPLTIGGSFIAEPDFRESREWQIASDATSGTSTFYLHKEDPDYDTTYNAAGMGLPEPTVFKETTGNGSTTTFSSAPCEASTMTDASNNSIRFEMDSTGDYCIGTYYTQPVGQSIAFETSDTNSITVTGYGTISGSGTVKPRFRIYQFTAPSTYNLIADLTGATAFTSSTTTSTLTGTPSANRTLAATDRIAIVLTSNVTVADGTGGQDYGTARFDESANAPARVTMSYTLLTPSKPSLAESNDDDFTSAGSNNCATAAPSGWTCHTTNGNWNRSSLDTEWMSITNIQGGSLGTDFNTTPSNTFLYKTFPSGDGAVTTVVNAATTGEINNSNAADPYFHSGLVFWTSNTDYIQVQVHNAVGTRSVQVNNSGTLDGTRTATLSSGSSTWNRVWLRITKSGTDYTASYSTDGTSFNNLGSAISHGTAFTRMGLNSYAALVNSQYSSVFEHFDSTIAPVTITIQGSCKAYDQSTNCGDLGTIKYAVGGTVDNTNTDTGGGTGGTFTISNVPQPSNGNVITVFVDGAAGNGDKAMAITKYDGSGPISGLLLYKEHLTIGSSDTGATLTSAELGSYDNSTGDPDIFTDYDGINTFTVDGNGFSTQEELYIQSGWTVRPDSGGGDTLSTHDLENLGTLNMDNNTLTVTGSFLNSGTYSKTSGATVNFTSTATGETITPGTGNFANMTFNGSGGEWTLQAAMTIDTAGTLSMQAGTLKGTQNITITSNSDVTGTGGVINLTGGTFEFRPGATKNFGMDGSVSNTDWTFNNLTFANNSGSPITATILNGACATCDFNITGTLAVSKAGDSSSTTLSAARTWNLTATDNAKPFDLDGASGALTANASTFVYSGNKSGGNVTIENASFDSLSCTPGSAEIYETSGSTTVGGTLNVGTNCSFSVSSSTTTSLTGSTLTLTGTLTGDGLFTYQSATAFPTTGTMDVRLQIITSANNTILGARTYNKNVDIYQDSSSFARTTTLGTAGGQTLNFGGNLVIQVAQGQDATLSGTSWNPTINVTGDLDFTGAGAGTEIIQTGTGVWTVSGNVTFTDGTYTATSGNTLKMNGTSKTLTSASQPLSNFEVSGGTVASGDTLTVNNNLVLSGGTYTAPTSLTVKGDWTNSGGTFAEGTGTVTLNGTASMALNSGCVDPLTGCANQNFYDLIINKTAGAGANDNVTLTTNGIEVSDTLTLTAGELIQGTLNVRVSGATAVSVAAAGIWTNISTGDLKLGGTFTTAGTVTFNSNNGAQCVDGANDIVITSTVADTTRLWTNTGTLVLYNVEADDMTDSSITASTSDLTDPQTTWTADGCVVQITVSGGVFTDDGEGTPATDDGNNAIKVAVNGAVATGTDAVVDGSWSFSINQPSTNDILTFFINGEDTESEEATTVVKYDGTGDVDLVKMYQSMLVIGTDTGSSNTDQTITNADLATTGNGYENSDDEDVLYSVAAGTLTVDDDANKTETLYIIAGDTFRPDSAGGDTVTTHHLKFEGTYTTDDNVTQVAGNFTNAGTFTASTGSIVMNGSLAQTFTTNAAVYNILTLNNTGTDGANDNVTISGNLDTDGALNVSNGDLILNSGNPNVNTGGDLVIGASALVTKGSGTWTFDGSGTSTITDGAINQDLGTVVVDGTTKTIALASSIVVTKMTVTDILDLASSGYTLTLTGTGTGASRPLIVTGTLTEGTNSIVKFTGGGATTSEVQNETYDKLSIHPSSAGSTWRLGTAGAQTITVTSDFAVGDGVNSLTLDWTNYDPALNLAGNTSLGNGATWTKSDSATLTFDGTAAKTYTDSNGTKQDLGTVVITKTHGTPSNNKITLASSMTVTTMTISASNTLDLASSGYTLTLTGIGTAGSKPLTVSGTLTPNASSTVAYTGVGATDVTAATYNNLSLTPVLASADVAYGASGAVTATGNLSVNPSGTANALTWTLAGATNITGTLTITRSGGSATSVVTTSGSNHDVNAAKIDIQTGGTLTANNSTIILTGTSGTILTRAGTFTAGGSMVRFRNNGSATLTSGTVTFNNVITEDTDTTADTPTFGSGALTVNANFYIASQSGTTNNLTVTLGADVAVTTSTQVYAQDAARTATLSTGGGNFALTTGTLFLGDQGSGTGTLTANGSIITITAADNADPVTVHATLGVFNRGTSTFRYSSFFSTGNVSIKTLPYHHLDLAPSSSETYILRGDQTGTNDITGTVTIGANATLDAHPTNNYALEIGGSFTNSGVFTAQAGTVTFDGTGTITSGASSFNNVTTSGSGTITLANATHTIIGNLILGSSATIVGGSSTVAMTGTAKTIDGGGQTLSGLTISGTETLQNTNLTVSALLTVDVSQSLTINSGRTLTLSGNTGTTLTLNGTINGPGTLTYQNTATTFPTSGTLAATLINRFDTVNGNLVIPARTDYAVLEAFGGSANARTVTLGTAGSQTITTSSHFYIIADAATPNHVTLQGATWDPTLNVGGDFDFTGGGSANEIVTAPDAAATWTVSGNVNLTDGTWTPGAETLVMNGSSKTLTTGTSTLNNVTLSGTITLANAVHTIAGNFDMTGGTITAGTSTVTMTGTANLTFGTGALYNFTVNGSGNTVTATNSGSVDNILRIGGDGDGDNDTFSFGTQTITSGPSGTITIPGSGTDTCTSSTGVLAVQNSTLPTTGVISCRIRFDATNGDITAPARTYGTLVFFYNNSNTNDRVITMGTAGGQTFDFDGTVVLQAQGNNNLIVEANTYDPTIDATGSAGVNAAGTGAGEETLSMGSGTWTNGGLFTVTAPGENITNTTGGTLIQAGNFKNFDIGTNTLNNLTFSDTPVLNSGATLTGNLVLHSGISDSSKTFTLTGTSNTVTGNGASIFNLDVNPSTAGTYTLTSSDLTVSGTLTVATGDTFSLDASRTLSATGTTTLNGIISGAGTLRFTDTSSGPDATGTLSSIVRYDATTADISAATFDARTYGGKVELFSTKATAANVSCADASTYTISGASSHLHLYANGAGNLNLLCDTATDPTVTIGGDLDFVGTDGTGAETITSGAGTWSVAGHVNFTDGTYTATSGNTLVMNGTGTLTSDGEILNNFTTSGGGTITLANATHTVNGNLSIGSTGLTAGTSTVTMTGTSNTIEGGGKTLTNLTINPSSAGTITLNTSDLNVSGTLLVETGDTLSLSASRTLGSWTTTTINGTISGAGTLQFVNTSNGPGTSGTLSSVVRYDASSGNIADTSFDARTYEGRVELFIGSSASAARTVTCADAATYTISGASSHLYLINNDNEDTLTLNCDTATPPTINIGGDLDFTGTGSSSEIITSGAGTWTVSGNVNFTSGTYTATADNILVMDGTGTLTSAANALHHLTLSGSITLANATHTLNGSLDMTGGTITAGSSVITMNGSGMTIDGGGQTLSGVSINGNTTLQNTDVTASGILTIGAGLNLTINASRTWTQIGVLTGGSGVINGAGTLRFTDTSAGPGSGNTISAITRYDATNGNIANTTVDARTYDNRVEFYSNSTTARTITFASGSHILSGASSNVHVISDGASPGDLTLAGAAQNPTVTIGGNLDFTGAGSSSEVITSGTGTWTVTGNVDFTGGTYTATSGNTLVMNGASKSLTTNAQTLDNVTFSGSGTTTLADTVTASGNVVLNSSIASGTVVMTGTKNLTGGTATLTNFTANGTNTVVSLITSDLTVSGTLTVGGDAAANTDEISIGSGRILSSTSTTTITDATDTISGAGTLRFTDTSAGPGTTGTLSSVVRYDATTANIASTTFDARTYAGIVELYSNSGTAKTVSCADASTYTLSGASSHLHILAAGAGSMSLLCDTATDPTINIGGDLDYTGAGGGAEAITTGAGTWTVTGSIDLTGGTITSTTGNTVIMNGLTKNLIGAAQTLYNLTVDPSSASTITVQISNVIVTNALVVAAGDTISISSGIILTAGTQDISWGDSASTITGAGILNFGGASGGPGTGGTLSAITRYQGAVPATTVDARTYGNIVRFYIDGGADQTSTLGAGTFTLSGASSHFEINNDGGSFSDLVVDGSVNNPTVNIGGNLTTGGGGPDVKRLITGTGTWTVSGNITFTASQSDLVATSGNTIIMNGASKTISTTSVLHHLTISGSVSQSSSITTNGNFTISGSSSYDLVGNTLDIKGNWTNGGTFTHSLGYVFFSGSSPQTLTTNNTLTNASCGGSAVTQTAGKQFYGLYISSSSTVALAAGSDLGVDEHLTITSGTLDIGDNSNQIYIKGNLDMGAVAGSAFDGRTSTYTGCPQIIMNGDDVGDAYVYIKSGETLAVESIAFGDINTADTNNYHLSSVGGTPATLAPDTSLTVLSGTLNTKDGANPTVNINDTSGAIYVGDSFNQHNARTKVFNANDSTITAGDIYVTDGQVSNSEPSTFNAMTSTIDVSSGTNGRIFVGDAGNATYNDNTFSATTASTNGITTKGVRIEIGDIQATSNRTWTLNGTSGLVMLANTTLNATGSTSTWNLAAGMDVAAGTTFTAGSTTFVQNGTGAASIDTDVNLTFNNLTLDDTGNRTITVADSDTNSRRVAVSGTFTLDGTVAANAVDLQIGTGSFTATLALDNNTVANSSLTVPTGRTLTTIGASVLELAGNFTNNGTLTENTGKILMDGTNSSTLNSGCSDTDACTTTNLYDLEINKTGAADGDDNVTLTSNGIRTANSLVVTDGEMIQGAFNVRAEGTSAATVASGGKWSNISTGDITFGGTFSNSGNVTWDKDGNGNGCGPGDTDDISLTTTDGATVRDITGAGVFTLYDLTVNYMNATVAITVNGGTDGGTNTGSWTFNGCGITISGVIRTSGDETAAYDCTTDPGGNLQLHSSVDGAASDNGTCSAVNGTFSFTADAPAGADSPVVIYIDSGEAAKGTTATLAVNSGSNISNLDIFIDRVVVTDESGTSMTNAKLATGDNADAGIRYAVSAGNLTVESGMELHVKAGKTFAPGGIVTTTATGTTAGTAGDVHIPATATLSMGTNSLSVGGDYNNAGTFSKSTGQTTTMTATGTGFTITPGTGNFDSLTFDGSGGGWSNSAAMTVDVDLTMAAGTLSGTNDVTVTGNAVGSAGVITKTGGLFKQRVGASKNFGPTTAATSWTFNDLEISNSHGSTGFTVTAQSCATCGVTVSGVLYVGKSGDAAVTTLNAGDKTWTITGAGQFGSRPFRMLGSPAAVLTASTSTFNYTGTSITDIESGYTYYNLGVGTTSDANAVSYRVFGNTVATNNIVVGHASSSATDTLYLESGTFLREISGTLTLTANGAIGGNGGTFTYRSTQAFPTTGTISAPVQFDTVNNDLTIPGRTFGGDVIVYTNASASHGIVTLGSGASETITISGNLSVSANDSRNITAKGDTNNPTVNVTGNISMSKASTGTPAIISGTGTWTVGGDVNFTNGTYTAATGNEIIMNGSAKTLTTASNALHDLRLSGSTTLANETHTIAGFLYMDATVTAGSSTVAMTGTGMTIDGGGQTLNNLTISGTTTLQTTDLTVSGTLTVDNTKQLTINSGRTVSATGTTTLNGTITGAGTLRFTDTSTGPSTTGTLSSIVRYDASAANIVSTTFDARTYGGRVEIYANSGSNRTITPAAGTYTLSGSSSHLWVIADGAGNTTLSTNSNDPTLNIGGDLDYTGIGGGTEIINGTGSSRTWTITGNVDFTGGTFSSASGENILMDGTANLIGNGQTVDDLTINGSGNTVTVTGSDITVNSVLTIGGAADSNNDTLSIASGRKVRVGTNGGTITIHGSGTDTISGAGTLEVTNGPLSANGVISSIVRFDTTVSGGVTMPARTYGGLVEVYNNHASTARSLAMAAGTHTLSGDLNLLAANGGNVTLNGATNNPTVNVTGNVDFTGGGGGTEAITSGTGTWTVGGNIDFTDGTYTATTTAGTISWVQDDTLVSDSSSGTIAKQFGSTVTSGNLIVVTVGWGDQDMTPTVADNQGNTYTLIDQAFGGTNQGIATYYAKNVNGGTVTITASFSPSVAFRRLQINEYSGADRLAPLDVHALNWQVAVGTGTDAITSGNVITNFANELVYGSTHVVNGTPSAITQGTGFTLRETDAGNILASEDKTLAVAGTTAATFTHGGSNDKRTSVATFKPATIGNTLVMNGSTKTLTTAGSSLFHYTVSGGSITQVGALAVTGNYLQSAGTFIQAANNDFTATGYGFTLDNGTTFTKASGTGKLILDGDPMAFTDSNGSKQDLGKVQIGQSPGTVNLKSDKSVTSLTIASGDVYNTHGYEVDVSGAVDCQGTCTFDLSDSGTGYDEGDGSIINVGADWTMSGTGTFTHETAGGREDTIHFASTAGADANRTITTGGKAFRKVDADNAGTSNDDMIVSGNFTVDGTLTVTDGQLDLTTNDPTTDLNAAVTIGASGELIASNSATTTVAGNWTNNGIFTDSGGTVTLDGAAQQTLSGQLSGSGDDFNNLTITNNSGSDPAASPSVILAAALDTAGTFAAATNNVKLRFNAGSTYALNAITFSGTAGNIVYLRSSTPGTVWNINAGAGARTVTHTAVRDSNACGSSGGSIDGNDGTNFDEGNTSCWNINTISMLISDTTIGFGTCAPGAARYATGTTGSASDSADAHTVTLATSAHAGYTLTVYGPTLTSGGNTITGLGGSAVASSPGSEQFGLRAIKNSGAGAVSSPYDTANWAFGASATPQPVASHSANASTTEIGLRYICNVAGPTEAGTYSTDLTYVLTSTF